MNSNITLDRYVYNTDLGNHQTQNEKQAYCFGFCDACYNEQTYIDYVSSEEKYINAYKNGYNDGKQHVFMGEEDVKPINKKVWIYKVIKNDFLNHVRRNNLSEEYQYIYDLNMNDCDVLEDPFDLLEEDTRGMYF